MKDSIEGIFGLIGLIIGLTLLGYAFPIVTVIGMYLSDIHRSYIIVLALLLIMWFWYFDNREFIQFLGVILVLLIALFIVVFQSNERGPQRVRKYLMNSIGYSRYQLTQDISTEINYQDYNTNIKYSANKDLMNEFRNKIDVEKKGIVIMENMMWWKNKNDEKKTALELLEESIGIYRGVTVPRVTWKEANMYCNASTHENFNDWRLPTRSELGQYYRSDIKVNFDKSMIFWSSTKSEKDGYDYRGMSFDGKGWSISKNTSEYVLCVREL